MNIKYFGFIISDPRWRRRRRECPRSRLPEGLSACKNVIGAPRASSRHTPPLEISDDEKKRRGGRGCKSANGGQIILSLGEIRSSAPRFEVGLLDHDLHIYLLRIKPICDTCSRQCPQTWIGFLQLTILVVRNNPTVAPNWFPRIVNTLAC